MRSFFFKMLMISVLAVVLFVAGTMVRGVVADRMMNREVARQSISEGLAERQTLAGPLLRVSYTEYWQRPVTDKEGRVLRQEACTARHELLVLPETVQLSGGLISDPRQRGIFHINAYVLSGKLAGTLKMPALAGLSRQEPDSSVVIDSVELLLSVTDPRGLRKLELKVDGRPLALEPGTGMERAGSGARARLPDAPTLAGKLLPFEMALDLAGTDSFSMVPLARDTNVSLDSRWPHPSFGGRFLPERRTVTEKGFEAQWHVSALASNARQSWPMGPEGAARPVDTLVVSMIDPVDVYSMSDRASKYAELFIAITLGAFLLFELLRRLSLHPMNYLLIAAALLIFFLMLLSLSERLGFGLAYLSAASACVLLIGFYSAHLLRSLWLASGFTLGLGALYGALYMILLSEQNALLMGSLLLFALLACVMVGTRKVDWNALLAPSPAPELMD
ncbi:MULTISPECIES: cell envelope integrity protein CreD [unclassified Uliginosibacterium]|uniref:cell envelope integrity protein CreD n=1 Tax=unclassified Uliginosibacterium TaxID=2621521 RepID=UPI000C7D4CDC|nr:MULTISPECIES: cell envelope integrity protein CreD [unclassified Uliginosibacterium]MDO6386764.1 cell envelope integrity protein CreD [Uliginosibacterium sp. 31-12]PLK50582.1 cell envelope integrity protein CreD [Uliginosibacterium sp. TH139]